MVVLYEVGLNKFYTSIINQRNILLYDDGYAKFVELYAWILNFFERPGEALEQVKLICAPYLTRLPGRKLN